MEFDQKRKCERKYYVVFKGTRAGIYDSWEESVKCVTDFKGSLFHSFSSIEEAAEACNIYFQSSSVNETGSSNEYYCDQKLKEFEMSENKMTIMNSHSMKNCSPRTFDVRHYCYTGCIILVIFIRCIVGKFFYLNAIVAKL